MSKLGMFYFVCALGLLGWFCFKTTQGWGPVAKSQSFIPKEVVRSNDGYRSNHYWVTRRRYGGYRGGK